MTKYRFAVSYRTHHNTRWLGGVFILTTSTFRFTRYTIRKDILNILNRYCYAIIIYMLSLIHI